jgi:hypothetical protein
VKRLAIATLLLVLGLAAGAAIGAFIGQSVEKEAAPIDAPLTTFAPIDVTDATIEMTNGIPLTNRIPWRDLNSPLILATNGAQGSNSDLWRWEPAAGAPERISVELPVDSWWYDQRNGTVLGSIVDPQGRRLSLIAGPLEGPYELIQSDVTQVFPALDQPPNGGVGGPFISLFRQELTNRIYADQRQDGFYFWDADLTADTPTKSQVMGPYQVNGNLGLEAGVFDGGTYFAVPGFQGITVVSFVGGEVIETFFAGSLSSGILAPNVLVLGNLSGPIYIDLSTHDVTDMDQVEVTASPEDRTCAPMFAASSWAACFDWAFPRSYVSKIGDNSLEIEGRLAGYSSLEGLSFAHVATGTRLQGENLLIVLDEESSSWAEIAQFDAAIYGVWSER